MVPISGACQSINQSINQSFSFIHSFIHSYLFIKHAHRPQINIILLLFYYRPNKFNNKSREIELGLHKKLVGLHYYRYSN